jgi:hypothetical protein
VIAENVRAAGALEAAWLIGERARLFDVVDAIVSAWMSGRLSIGSGPAADQLSHFARPAPLRLTDAERAQLYRRALGIGTAALPPGVAANATFPQRWGALLSAASACHEAATPETPAGGPLALAALYTATEHLQANLTTHLQDLVPFAAQVSRQLQEALAIASCAAIAGQYGAAPGVWRVIEAVAEAELGARPPVASYRALASAARRIFEWLASFDRQAVQQPALQALLAAADSWLTALGSDPDTLLGWNPPS